MPQNKHDDDTPIIEKAVFTFLAGVVLMILVYLFK